MLTQTPMNMREKMTTARHPSYVMGSSNISRRPPKSGMKLNNTIMKQATIMHFSDALFAVEPSSSFFAEYLHSKKNAIRNGINIMPIRMLLITCFPRTTPHTMHV